MTGPDDPLGRRAFFSQPVGIPVAPAPGRRALFSTPGRPKRGQVVVECRTCLNHTSIGLTGLASRLVGSLWVPGRPWPRLMRCPNCSRISWCRVHWAELVPVRPSATKGSAK